LVRAILIKDFVVTVPVPATIPDAAVAVESQDMGATPVSLAALHIGARGTVHSVSEDGATRGELLGDLLGEDSGATIVMRLIEIGFVPGEPFEIIAESRPGGDPIAVRIGGSCFALRRREAAAVMVTTT
jgi:Fe2+ transport system protein FeoA